MRDYLPATAHLRSVRQNGRPAWPEMPQICEWTLDWLAGNHGSWLVDTIWPHFVWLCRFTYWLLTIALTELKALLINEQINRENNFLLSYFVAYSALDYFHRSVQSNAHLSLNQCQVLWWLTIVFFYFHYRVRIELILHHCIITFILWLAFNDLHNLQHPHCLADKNILMLRLWRWNLLV